MVSFILTRAAFGLDRDALKCSGRCVQDFWIRHARKKSEIEIRFIRYRQVIYPMKYSKINCIFTGNLENFATFHSVWLVEKNKQLSPDFVYSVIHYLSYVFQNTPTVFYSSLWGLSSVQPDFTICAGDRLSVWSWPRHTDLYAGLTQTTVPLGLCANEALLSTGVNLTWPCL